MKSSALLHSRLLPTGGRPGKLRASVLDEIPVGVSLTEAIAEIRFLLRNQFHIYEDATGR